MQYYTELIMNRGHDMIKIKEVLDGLKKLLNRDKTKEFE